MRRHFSGPSIRRSGISNVDIELDKQTLLYSGSEPTRLSEMPESPPRSLPVIVITGTPGTGKTTHAQLLVEQSPVPLHYINVSDLIKERMLHDGFDEEWQTYIVDEDKVCSSHHHSWA